jgi:hypothetical protein
LGDESFAVVDEQANVEFGPGEFRDRQLLEAFAQRCPRDRDRVDDVGLAALAGAAALADGELGRDADDRLSAGEQEPLERAGDVPAVLDRPDTFAAVITRLREHGLERVPPRRQCSLGEHAPARRLDRGDRMRPLVRVGADHDHRLDPPFGWDCWRRIAGGQFSVRSRRPRIYQVTPKILRPRSVSSSGRIDRWDGDHVVRVRH